MVVVMLAMLLAATLPALALDIEGTEADDTLYGTEQLDVIYGGLGGSDTIEGGPGTTRERTPGELDELRRERAERLRALYEVLGLLAVATRTVPSKCSGVRATA